MEEKPTESDPESIPKLQLENLRGFASIQEDSENSQTESEKEALMFNFIQENYPESVSFKEFLSDLQTQIKELKVPLPKQYREKLQQLAAEFNISLDKPNKAKSKVKENLHKPLVDESHFLGNTIKELNVKKIKNIKNIKSTNKSVELLGVCFLLLLDKEVPPKPWEEFQKAVAQPGLVVQKLRNLPQDLEQRKVPCENLFKISKVLSSVDVQELNQASYKAECYLLLQLFQEIVEYWNYFYDKSQLSQSSIKIPTLEKPQPKKPLKTPPKQTVIPRTTCHKHEDNSDSFDLKLIDKYIELQKKQNRELRQQKNLAKWQIERECKREMKAEAKREEEKELQYNLAVKKQHEQLSQSTQKLQAQERKKNQYEEVQEQRRIKSLQKQEQTKQMMDDILRNAQNSKSNAFWEKVSKKERQIKQHSENLISVAENRRVKKLRQEEKKIEEQQDRQQELVLKKRFEFLKLKEEEEKLVKEMEVL